MAKKNKNDVIIIEKERLDFNIETKIKGQRYDIFFLKNMFDISSLINKGFKYIKIEDCEDDEILLQNIIFELCRAYLFECGLISASDNDDFNIWLSIHIPEIYEKAKDFLYEYKKSLPKDSD